MSSIPEVCLYNPYAHIIIIMRKGVVRSIWAVHFQFNNIFCGVIVSKEKFNSICQDIKKRKYAMQIILINHAIIFSEVISVNINDYYFQSLDYR